MCTLLNPACCGNATALALRPPILQCTTISELDSNSPVRFGRSRAGRCRRHYGVATFSSAALRRTLLPPLTFSFRSQSLNPVFFTVTV